MYTAFISSLANAKHAGRRPLAKLRHLSGRPMTAYCQRRSSTLGSNSLRCARRPRWCTLCSKMPFSLFVWSFRRSGRLFSARGKLRNGFSAMTLAGYSPSCLSAMHSGWNPSTYGQSLSIGPRPAGSGSFRIVDGFWNQERFLALLGMTFTQFVIPNPSAKILRARMVPIPASSW